MWLDHLDRLFVGFMRRWGVVLLRYSLALIYFWFGVLKPLGISPADPLLVATVGRIPLWSPETWITLIGFWEMAIGVMFLFRRTLRIVVIFVVLHVIGTSLPLVLTPSMVYQSGHIPYGLTTEGQYVVKNLLILTGTFVIGGTLRREDEVPPAKDEPAKK